MLTIINENDREMTYSSTGFNVYIDGRKKYYGRLKDALKKFGWFEAASMLGEDVELSLREKMKELLPEKVRVKWSFEGVAGPYEAETYPHHRGVTLNLTAFTDSHLAKSPTTSSTVFPSTHAQAAMRMVAMDVESRAFKDGPFASENELMEFIRSRLDLVSTAMTTFTPIEGKGSTSVDDEDDDSEDDGQEAA